MCVQHREVCIVQYIACKVQYVHYSMWSMIQYVDYSTNDKVCTVYYVQCNRYSVVNKKKFAESDAHSTV